MAYDNEKVRSSLRTRLEANLPGQLDVVEAEWAASDPLTLPDPVTWYEGHKPTILELESAAFPFVAILVPLRTPQDRPSRWGYQEQELTAFVDFFVVAADEATVNKLVHRYAQAIVLELQAERVIEGYQQINHEPEVKTSEASRHKKTANADSFNDADVDFIQMGRAVVMLE
jgi:hypothetical protein